MEHKEDIDEWQQIEQQHQSHETSEWNMVLINKNYLEIEVQSDQSSSSNHPSSPVDNEGSLQIVPSKSTDSVDGSSSPLTTSSSVSDAEDSEPLDWRVRVATVLKVRLEAMREKVVSNWPMCTRVFWSFRCVAGGAAVAAAVVTASLVYVGIRRRRRRVQRESVDRWVALLREKDEVSRSLLPPFCMIT
ncbi:hypothetical protein RJT34_02624 [Clitoria ternatea]|uniref:Transmembrane protein n=1 Tax=Clitoria ternatea TaxID=43366 RepID=A0AAN9KHF4_CLITE